MAIAFGSSQSATTNSSTTITISKPSGLSEGDLMVCFLYVEDTGTASSATGWTQLAHTSETTNRNLTALGKIADSSDVAASNFTFNTDGSNGDETIGVLSRITASEGGFDIDNLIVADADTVAGSSGTATFSGGVDPAPNCFLMMATGNFGNYTHSNYRIVTDNPSWTELYDNAYTDVEDITMAVAYASRPEGTATGNYLVDFVTADGTTHSGILLAINETISVTVTPGTMFSTTTIPNATVSADANVTVGVPNASFTVPNATVTTTLNEWDYESLPTPDVWTNE